MSEKQAVSERRLLAAPSPLAALRYFLAALIASTTLEAIGVGLHAAVHRGIHLFHRFPLVWDGFTSLSATQLAIATYLVLTLIRYLAAMLGSAPLFRTTNGELAASSRRLAIALFDTLLMYLALMLIFIASLSAQDATSTIETATWLILALIVDVMMCAMWVFVLRNEHAEALGFSANSCKELRSSNARWLMFSAIELLLWVGFILEEQNRGGLLHRGLTFTFLFGVIVLDFVSSRAFWRMTIGGTAWRSNETAR